VSCPESMPVPGRRPPQRPGPGPGAKCRSGGTHRPAAARPAILGTQMTLHQTDTIQPVGDMMQLRAGVAIDLGTVNTLVWVRGRGIVVEEPSAIAVDTAVGKAIATGEAADA